MEGNFPMKKTARLFGAYLPMLLVLLPAAVVLRTIACFNNMNMGGYFDNKTLITVANVTVVVIVAISLSYLLIAKKDIKLVYRPQSPLNFIPGAIICAALIFVAIYTIILATPNIKEYFNRQPDDRTPSMLVKPMLTLCTGITAALSIPFFAVSAVWAKAKSVIISNLGLMILVFLCLMVAGIYFDKSAALNMPAKVVSLMAYLSAAVFFLYEIRLPLGREKWRAYICFSMICTALCAYSAIPSLIVLISNPDTLPRLATSEFEIIMTLSLFIFASLKLALTATLIEDKESAVAQKVREYALERAKILEPEEDEVEEVGEGADTAPESEEETEDEQVANQESFFEDEAEKSDTQTAEEMPIEDAGLLAELEEISEERRLELSANIDTTAEEGEKEADNQ